MLALLLAMGGAWAQGPTNVTQFTTDMIAGWANDNSDLTLADLQALGFEAVDASVATAWTGAPQGEFAVLIYGFNEGNFNYISFDAGDAYPPSYTSFSKKGFYENIKYGPKHFYTGAPIQEIELTKTGDNQWTLGQTPDYDLDLNVVYYQRYALKEIPANWQVKVDGVDKTAAIDGDSLKISETAQVLLTPDHPERVKKVMLIDEAVRVNIDGITLDITGCTTWADIIARNPGVLIDDDGWVASQRGILVLGGGAVETSTPYDPARQSDYEWVSI